MARNRMSLKFVISDVDGTLVNHDKKLTQPTIDAVARLQAAGVPFTIISARPPSGIFFLIDALKPTGPIAAFNGGTIIAPDGSVVERHRLFVFPDQVLVQHVQHFEERHFVVDVGDFITHHLAFFAGVALPPDVKDDSHYL